MKFKAIIEYEYPIEHKPPVKAEIILHGDRVITDNIKLLDQESIFDKIRAEIEQNAYPIVYGVNNHEKGMTLYGIFQIIDKYKADGE